MVPSKSAKPTKRPVRGKGRKGPAKETQEDLNKRTPKGDTPPAAMGTRPEERGNKNYEESSLNGGESRGFKEQFYPLIADPELNAAGVEIGARAKFREGKKPKLRIIFRTGSEQAEVDCVVVGVQEGFSKQLTPEELFFALNSYVAGIAEVGIAKMFALDPDAACYSFGFNTLLQSQVLKALFKVAPTATANRLVWAMDEMRLDLDGEIVKNQFTPPELLTYYANSPYNWERNVDVANGRDT